MNSFESRWTELTRRGQAARTARPENAPLGFASRVAAQARTSAAASVEEVWLQLCVRSLVAVSSLFLILGAVEWKNAPPTSLLSPGVENTVAQLLGAL